MSENSGSSREDPSVYRAVTESTTLTTVSGVTGRNACMLIFANSTATAATAVFTGEDAANATVTVPPESAYPPLRGSFATVGALGTGITCLAGWIDDGTIEKNP